MEYLSILRLNVQGRRLYNDEQIFYHIMNTIKSFSQNLYMRGFSYKILTVLEKYANFNNSFCYQAIEI